MNEPLGRRFSHQSQPRQDLPKRCPQCGIADPRFESQIVDERFVEGRTDFVRRVWVHLCASCHKPMVEWQPLGGTSSFAPRSVRVPKEIEDPKVRRHLSEAIAICHAPSACRVSCASAVDAMLKAKGLKEGSLNQRIKEAEKKHLITADMARWAHEVRLDANDERHADEDANDPTSEDAEKAVGFALGLAEILFVLPARVVRA